MFSFISKIKNIRYLEEKKRFLLFMFGLFLILFLAIYLFKIAYARYEIRAKINADIQKALYIFEDEKISFNIDPDGIIPSSDPYIYRFSISNFNETKESDVDLSYDVKIRTTTNLPITIRLYRNELYDAVGATNILSGATTQQDEDDAWYKLYTAAGNYQMFYVNHTTDVYSLVIDFPSSYANDTTYANYLESIEVIINSRQII